MFAGQLTNGGNSLSSWASPAARTDSTVGDDPRDGDRKLRVVLAYTDRDDAHMADHRTRDDATPGKAA